MRLVIPLVGLMAWASAALAQAPDTALARVETRKALQSASDPTLSSATTAPSTNIQLLASSQNQKTAQLQTGLKPIPTAAGVFSATAQLSAPLDTASSRTDLLDLTGLQKSATFAIGLGLTNGWSPHLGDNALSACRKLNRAILDDSLPVLQAHIDAARTRLAVADFARQQERATAESKDIDETTARINALKDRVQHVECDVQGLTALEDTKYRAYADTALQNFDFGSAWLFGLRATIGAQDASHTDSVTLKQVKHQVTTYGLKAGIGHIIEPINTVIAVDFVGAETYRAAPSGQLCTPIGTNNSLHCTGATLAAPSKQDHEVGTIELRRFFTNFAVNPQLDYDFRTYATVLKLPIYIYKDATGGFSGGAIVAWQLNQQHQFTLAAFVSNVFGLFSIPGQ